MSSKVTIKSNEHVFVAGRTGSGKTYLTRKYLAGYKHVVVLDTKGKIEWPEIPEEEKTLVTKLSELEKAQTPKIIYRPNWSELDFAYYDAFFQWVYARQNTIVWVDEVMSICPNPLKIPSYYKACLTRGRELGIGVWSLTQRPAGIPLVVMSEATHFFVFELNMKEDRKRLTEITGMVQFMQKPKKYHFWYYNSEMDNPVLAVLKTVKEG